MRRLTQSWLILVISLLAIGGALFLRKSDSDRVREHLDALATALEFRGSASQPNRYAALRACVEKRVADPVTIRIAPQGEARLSTDELLAAANEATRDLFALGVTLSNIGVNVDEGANRASAKGDVRLDLVLASQERRTEPRKFAATLIKSPTGWVVIHAEISEPHIDQPEARP